VVDNDAADQDEDEDEDGRMENLSEDDMEYYPMRSRMNHRYRRIVASTTDASSFLCRRNRVRQDKVERRQTMSPTRGTLTNFGMRQALRLVEQEPEVLSRSLQVRRRRNCKAVDRDTPCTGAQSIDQWTPAAFKIECFRKTQRNRQARRQQRLADAQETNATNKNDSLVTYDTQPHLHPTGLLQMQAASLRNASTYAAFQEAIFDCNVPHLRGEHWVNASEHVMPSWNNSNHCTSLAMDVRHVTECHALRSVAVGNRRWRTFKHCLRDTTTYTLDSAFQTEILAWTAPRGPGRPAATLIHRASVVLRSRRQASLFREYPPKELLPWVVGGGQKARAAFEHRVAEWREQQLVAGRHDARPLVVTLPLFDMVYDAHTKCTTPWHDCEGWTQDKRCGIVSNNQYNFRLILQSLKRRQTQQRHALRAERDLVKRDLSTTFSPICRCIDVLKCLC